MCPFLHLSMPVPLPCCHCAAYDFSSCLQARATKEHPLTFCGYPHRFGYPEELQDKIQHHSEARTTNTFKFCTGLPTASRAITDVIHRLGERCRVPSISIRMEQGPNICTNFLPPLHLFDCCPGRGNDAQEWRGRAWGPGCVPTADSHSGKRHIFKLLS